MEKRARELTSGSYENRGARGTIGHYLLSLVLEEKGDKPAAAAERQKALAENPHAGRAVLTEAQIDIARAHQ